MSDEHTWRGIAEDKKEDEDKVKAAALLRSQSRRLLGSLLRPYLGALVLTSILVTVNMAAWLMEPWLIGLIIDNGVRVDDERELIRLVTLLGWIMVVNLITWGAFLWISGKLGQNVLLDLRMRLYRKFQELSLAFHEKYTSGRVVARLTSDIDALSELLATGLHEMVTSALAVVAIGVILFFLDVRLALATFIVFPIVMALTLWFRRHSEIAYRAVRDAVALVIVFYNESLGGIRAVQSFRRERRNQQIFEDLDAKYRDANVFSQKVASLFGPGVRFLGHLSQAIVLLYGGYLVAGDRGLELGMLVSFMVYLRRFFGPLQDLSQFYNVFQAAAAALEKLAGVLEETNSVPEPAQPELAPDWLPGRVEFEDLTFGYRDRPVISEMSFVVPAAQTVALVGRTGAGKTTMARLIARFYDPSQGRVLLDGLDLRDLSEERLRRAVTVVTQESFLFSGTVADNIAFGKPGVSREEVEEAAAAIGAHEFIAGLPDGYDTDVKKRGGRLSSGQKQLVSFARAFLADPSVLILDEATSSLDIPTERVVQHALRTLLSDRTAFIIAHRLTTVEIADRVLVIDDGRIVEDGSPRELQAEGGRYHDLHEAWQESLV
ncbi:MAG: ABC transporter ATP-binding protein [Actinomycetota bacterium]